MLRLKDNDIGGAIIRRTFTSGGQRTTPGQKLSREEVLSMRPVNRNSLVNKGYMDLYPNDAIVSAPSSKLQRFPVSVGFGKFIVIEGARLTDEAVSREQAYALCGQAEPEKGVRRKKKVAEAAE